MNNLASIYNEQGKYDEAEVLYKQCLERRIAVLGENHPNTISTISNLEAMYESQGRHDEANALKP